MRPRPDQLTLMESLLRCFAHIDANAAQQDTLEVTVPSFDGEASLTLHCDARL